MGVYNTSLQAPVGTIHRVPAYLPINEQILCQLLFKNKKTQPAIQYLNNQLSYVFLFNYRTRKALKNFCSPHWYRIHARCMRLFIHQWIAQLLINKLLFFFFFYRFFIPFIRIFKGSYDCSFCYAKESPF